MVQSTTIDRFPVPTVKNLRGSILLIEEDSRLRDSLADFLEDEGYEVDKCIEASEAFVLLSSGVAPDLVLLDEAALREADWPAQLRRLRDASLSRVPVLLLSGLLGHDHVGDGEVDAALAKPVHPDTLLDTLARLLGSAAEERLSARALEVQRLSSLGGLSTGLANELNNPLSFVLGNLELARKKCEELGPRLDGAAFALLQEIERLLHHAQRGAGRVAEVVQSVASLPAERGQAGFDSIGGAAREEERRIDANFSGESRIRLVPAELRSQEPSQRELELQNADASNASSAGPHSKVAPARARVLVVDDEQLMCELLATMLSEDYEVVALTSARDALGRIVAGEVFDLVLCDLMMPDLTGMDLHAQLAREKPDQAARMVFMTGGTFTDRAQRFLAEHGRVQLQKPFRHDELLTLVQDQLKAYARSAQSNLH
jgi:DNA-binding response OmpR family regulator